MSYPVKSENWLNKIYR